MRLPRLRALLFDMDGVLYRGQTPLPGAAALLAFLDRAGLPYALVTNNSTRTPRQYARLLAQMRMRVPPARIVTSSVSTAAYLRQRLPAGARVLVVGEAALRRALVDAGFVPAWEHVAAVVVGLDRHVSYRKLALATRALLDGARFVLTNPDLLLPTESGVIPGAGSLAAALHAATGRRPTVIGKPHPRLLREALARLGARPARAAIVGDQVATDVAAGRAAGLYTILVRTGVTAPASPPGRALRPDLVVRDLRELHRRLVATGVRRRSPGGAARGSRHRVRNGPRR
ncbi:MAG: HAD-IIA family hydrolase [Armatimonadota bacterium]|nr:HAD-IIA family hydrolase [Armatimonadota bacterium]MDR7486047.1 HAD-IIA family hydrolase [Armatimonadota bacterium]MDR7532618.1 HAD-IIA family hydrolase [Armatimonadota bacterium]MDR7536173.1 HAD-IIA family hydrolase [Armatimonadota bacterium]